METIFKKGDKVFDYYFGWGEVVRTDFCETYPLLAVFDGGEHSYTANGACEVGLKPTLSFTEYAMQGFSQERPIELPEIGEEIMVSDDKNIWRTRKVDSYSDGKIVVDTGRSWKHFKRLR